MSRSLLLVTGLLSAPAVAFRVKRANSTSGASGKVVTMGDSYSSGTGIHKDINKYQGTPLECTRDFDKIPGAQLAYAEGLKSINIACGGDELDSGLYGDGIFKQFDELQATYPEEASGDWAGSTFVWTIGGNDIRSNGGDAWPGILVSCIISFYSDCHKEEKNQVANFDSVRSRAAEFANKVAQGASKASIRVLGYPRLLQMRSLCIPVPGVNRAAAQWMDDMVDELNTHLSNAVADAQNNNPGVDIEFVWVKTHLTVGACTSWNNDVHAIVLDGLSLSPMTFHPSQRGYNNYYTALGNSLGRSLPPSTVPTGSPVPWDVENILGGWDTDSSGELSIEEVLDMGDGSWYVSNKLRGSFGEADADQDDSLNMNEFVKFLEIVPEL